MENIKLFKENYYTNFNFLDTYMDENLEDGKCGTNAFLFIEDLKSFLNFVNWLRN